MTGGFAFLISLVCIYVMICAWIVVTASDDPPVATKANRACQAHQGIASDGIHNNYFICRDGFVANR